MGRLTSLTVLLLTALAPAAHAQAAQVTTARRAEATTREPGRSTQVLPWTFFYNLYDTLTRWNTSLQLEPGLATAWRSLNGTRREFTLRPGIKFRDGSARFQEVVMYGAGRPPAFRPRPDYRLIVPQMSVSR